MASLTGSVSPEQSAAKVHGLLNGPAGTPPPGLLPNFQDPPNLNSALIFTVTICMAVATVVVVMRMYTKLFLIRSVAYEDCELLNTPQSQHLAKMS